MNYLGHVRNGLLAAVGLCLIAPALPAAGNKLAVNPQSSGTMSSTGGVTTTTTIEKIDVTGMVLSLPCATITVSGNLLNVTHVTDLGNGFSTVSFISHPQGLKGVDENGNVYAAGGTLAFKQVVPTGQVSVLNIASSFTMIGRGSAPNVVGIQVVQMTVNANGTVTTSVEFLSFTCE